MGSGFIKIHRSILKWEWYDDTQTVRLFLHLIMKANYESKNWRGQIIKRGSFVSSQHNLQKELKLTRQKVRSALAKLELTSEISLKTTNGFTLITVCNYDKYQDVDLSTNQRITNEQPTNNHRVTQKSTNEQPRDNHRTTTTKESKEIEERKEVKKQRKGKNEFLLGMGFSESLRYKIFDFYEYRREIKKPMTKQAEKLFLKKIKKINEKTAIEQIEQSMLRAWVDIFPVKKSPEKNIGKGYFEPSEEIKNDTDRLKFS